MASPKLIVMNRQLRKIRTQGAVGVDLPRTRSLFKTGSSHKLYTINIDSRWPKDRLRPSSVAVSSPSQTQSLSLWNGSDDFTCQNDRIDAPPLPLPDVTEPVRVVIVRHGQSTWNAEGRIQGSTDLSVLTEKGVKQAEKTRDMLSSMRFARVFQSPLTRARQTADVVMQGQGSPDGAATRADAADASTSNSTDGRITLPSLREIDLYHFQGLLKHEGKELYGEQYQRWQKAPHTFELDGHAPVRELWHRASLAWQQLLHPKEKRVAQSGGSSPGSAAADPRVILVVAHNAINQGLVGTALGLPPLYFRRLPQNNAALSIFDMEPGSGAGGRDSADGSSSGSGSGSSKTRVTLSCLNQSPDNPFKNPDKVVSHVVLITPPTHGSAGAGPEEEAEGEEEGEEERAAKELSSLARVLSTLQVTHVLACPGVSSATTVNALLACQRAAAAAPSATAAAATDPGQGTSVAVEFLPSVQPAAALWEHALALAATARPSVQGGDRRQSYGNVLVLVDEQRHGEVVWAALGLDGGALSAAGAAQLRISPGGVSVIEFAADPRVTPATVRCINNTAHISSS